MVLVLDEIAVVLEPFVIAVFVTATRTVVVSVVIAAETVSVLFSQVQMSGYTMFGALIGIVSSNPHQHLSHFSFCG